MNKHKFTSKFLSRITLREDTGCWEWGGARCGNDSTYGQSTLDGRKQMAHRVAYQLFIGPLSDDLDLDHLCRNPICVNPRHLEPKTHRENMLSGNTFAAKNAAATHCPKGHPYDEKNTYVQPKGGRSCRTCNAIRQVQWRERNPGSYAAIERAARQRRAEREAQEAAQQTQAFLHDLGFTPDVKKA